MVSRRTMLATGMAAGAALTLSGGEARAEPTIAMIKADDGRDVRVTIWPAAGVQRGVMLFSHGAMSRPEKYLRLMEPWSRAGFKIYAPLHLDSTDHPDHAHVAMGDTWRGRLLDMRAVSRFADAPHFVSAGHSYGALTALVVGGATGERPAGLTGSMRDPRATSVVAFSPPGAIPTLVTKEGYSTLAVPALIETGTLDVPFGVKDARWQNHLLAYDAAPPGDKYAMVLEGADHYFGGLICESDRPGPVQTEPLALAVNMSLTFLRAYGLNDQPAMGELNKAITDTGPIRLARK